MGIDKITWTVSEEVRNGDSCLYMTYGKGDKLVCGDVCNPTRRGLFGVYYAGECKEDVCQHKIGDTERISDI